MKSSFCIDLQRFMLIPTKFPLSHDMLGKMNSLFATFPEIDKAILPLFYRLEGIVLIIN